MTGNILEIKETSKSPYVYINPSDGKILIKGLSTPDNAIEFFYSIIGFLDENSDNFNDIQANFILTYFSSSTGKCLLDTCKRLENIYKSGVNVQIFWYYEEDDEDMFEEGQDMEAKIRLPFQFIEYDQEDYENLNPHLSDSN